MVSGRDADGAPWWGDVVSSELTQRRGATSQGADKPDETEHCDHGREHPHANAEAWVLINHPGVPVHGSPHGPKMPFLR